MKGNGRSLPIRIIPYLPRMVERNLKKPQSGYTCLDREPKRPTCANLFGSDSVHRETNKEMRFRVCACQMPAEERLEVCLRHDAVLTGTQLRFAASILQVSSCIQQTLKKDPASSFEQQVNYLPIDTASYATRFGCSRFIFVFLVYGKTYLDRRGLRHDSMGASSGCGWERPPILRQSRTAEEGWSSSQGVGRGAHNYSPQKLCDVPKHLTRPRNFDLWVRSNQCKRYTTFICMDRCDLAQDRSRWRAL